MTRRIILILMVAATVAGCSRVRESRLNPFNWFGRSEAAEVVVTDPNADPRRLVPQIISLRAEQVPGGALLHATGLPPRQGYYDAELVRVFREGADGTVLDYEFRSSQPLDQTRVSTQRSREIVVGTFISEQTLAGVRQIRITAAGNALVIRR